MNDLVRVLNDAVVSFNEAINDELSKEIVADVQTMVDSTPADISSRYWLQQFLEPLSRKELKSIVDGFLVQLLNEDQSKKLVKFLLLRFPQYYKETIGGEPTEPTEQAPSDFAVDIAE